MKIADQNIALGARQESFIKTEQRTEEEKFKGGLLTEQRISSQQTMLRQSAQYGTQQHKTPWTESRHHTEPKTVQLSQAPEQTLRKLLDRVTLSPQAQVHESAAVREHKASLPPKLLEMIEAIESLVERMSGKKPNFQIYGYHKQPENQNTQLNRLDAMSFGRQLNMGFTPFSSNNLNITNDQLITEAQMEQTGSRITITHQYLEKEVMQFSASGNVTTMDGKKIDFALNSQMSRQFYSQSQRQIEEGFVLKDPLVVNFGGQPAMLTVNKIQFDIDNNGEEDAISFVQEGSGFLALDRNDDGVINDGTELFGAISGNGFADLRQYDEDKNGWIDENDAIFAELQIWHQQPNGYKTLSGLLELNIGAIYLDNVESPFTIKDGSNQTLGEVASSGIYLTEDGQAKTIQQINLAV